MTPRPAPSFTGAFEEYWRRRFERYAGLTDDDAGVAGWSTTGLAARVRHFARHCDAETQDALWVDIGCGAGTYTRMLAAAGARVVGVDYSAPTLRRAAAKGGALGWLQGDATQLPFGTASFDGALCLGVLQALSSPASVLGEMARVVKPGGDVWVDALNASCLPHMMAEAWRKFRRRRPHLRYDSPWRLRRQARSAGLVDVRILWLPILPGSLQRWQRWFENPLVERLLAALPFLGAMCSHAFVVVARVPAR